MITNNSQEILTIYLKTLMKNLTFLKLFVTTMFVMATALFAGCVDDNDDTEAPRLEVSPKTLVFDTDGTPVEGSQSYFEISANRHWTATVLDDKTWVTLSKMEGDGSDKVQVSIPEGITDEAKVLIQISNKVGVLMKEEVTIRSGNIVPAVVIYNETFGTGDVSSNPDVADYNDWNKTGEGVVDVTYLGEGVSIRNTGKSNIDAYEGASGPNVALFTKTGIFQISKIRLTTDQTNLKLTFGGNYSYKPEGGEWDNTFNIEKFKVALSSNGTEWVPLAYTKNNGDANNPYWILATANFTLKQGINNIYIKFTASSKGTLTLVFAESGKNVKINGKKNASDSNCIVTVDVAAGSVEITKGDTMNLFYMVYTPSGTSETTHTHKYESKITKQATCTETGVLTYTCTSTTGTCDKKTYTETIPATGHKFSTEWTVDVEATETTPGSKSHHCTVCDAKTDVTVIPATGTVEKPLTITASKTEADKTVTFTAKAAGGKEGYTYKFIVYNKTTGTWGLVQNYSSKNTCTWTKGSAGDRYFYVDVKDAAGNVVRSEALNVKIDAATPKVTLTGSSTSIDAGAKLTLTAQTTLGSGCTYKFIIFNPSTNQWFKLQDFSSSNTFTWTAGSDGTRLFYVDVKDADGNVTRSKALNVTIGNGSANWLSVKATVSSNTSKTGDKITFTAEGVGGKAGYTYKMVVYNKTTKIWGLVQNFSSNNTITWTAGTAGDREFYIDVKDADGNVARSAVMNVTTTK